MVSIVFYVHPILVEMIQFGEHMFQMSWFNHQLETLVITPVTRLFSANRGLYTSSYNNRLGGPTPNLRTVSLTGIQGHGLWDDTPGGHGQMPMFLFVCLFVCLRGSSKKSISYTLQTMFEYTYYMLYTCCELAFWMFLGMDYLPCRCLKPGRWVMISTRLCDHQAWILK